MEYHFLEIDFKSANIYKEYEFINNDSHGVIDLLLEYKDKVIIVDYKLKNIEDDAYLEQLNGYILAALREDKKFEFITE